MEKEKKIPTEEQREARRLYAREYAKKNPEKIHANYLKRKDKVRASSKEWREANPERFKELQDNWKLENADWLKAYRKAYNQEHRAELTIQAKQWRDDNRDHYRAYQRVYQRSYKLKKKEAETQAVENK